MAEYTGGAVTDLKVVRTGPQTFNVEFPVPEDGTGAGAQVQVRAAPVSAGEWWWGSTDALFTTEAGQYEAGDVVVQPVDAGFDLTDKQLHFRAVAFRFDEAEGKNKFSAITPPSPGLLVEFGTWTEPEPQPEPDPVVQQEFTVATPQAGDTGIAVELTWAGPLDSVTFFADGAMFDTSAGAPGEAATKFLPFGRELLEGELVTVYSVAHFEGADSEPWPDPPVQVTVAAAPAEPEPEPEPEPTDNPIVSAEPVAGTKDTLLVTWQDGSQAMVGRWGPWWSKFIPSFIVDRPVAMWIGKLQ